MNASSKSTSSSSADAAAGKWTDAECAQFEKGIILHGWGKWTQVGQLVNTRSSTQIKSHAQKFQKCHPDEVKRLQKEHSRYPRGMATRQKGASTKDKLVEKKAYEKKEKATPVRRRGSAVKKATAPMSLAGSIRHRRCTAKTAASKSKTVPTKTEAESVKLGDVGYMFRKKFDDGWYTGEVEEIRPLAEYGKDRQCVYTDGDAEDLSLEDLRQLAKFSNKNKVHQEEDEPTVVTTSVVLPHGVAKDPEAQVDKPNAAANKEDPTDKKTEETTAQQVAAAQVQQPQQQQEAASTRVIDFDYAIAFLMNVKNRFVDQPQTYRTFIEAMRVHQVEQHPIDEILEPVNSLLAEHPDLLQEFTQFLSDSAKKLWSKVVTEAKAKELMDAEPTEKPQASKTSGKPADKTKSSSHQN